MHPDALAYLLYTSGSSGTPKGVMQTHRGLGQVVDAYARDLPLGAGDRLCAPTSLAYTGTIWALLAALLNGAAFVAADFDAPHALLATLRRQRVTAAQLIVSLLRQLLRCAAPPAQSLPDLRVVYTGGEALHAQDVARFARLFPASCRLLYDFGSTEAGVITHLQVDLDGARAGASEQRPGDPGFPVGRPVPGTQVALVDALGRPVAAGTDGEIAVTGPGVSPGYWRDPELTQRRFRIAGEGRRAFLSGDLGRWRDDGCLLHRGRRDRQVKLRGYRVEPEEIEAALCRIEGVAAAAVAVETTAAGIPRLFAYIESGGNVPDVHALREALAAWLPAYMIPQTFVCVDALPLAANGKLDRAALAALPRARRDPGTPFRAPRNAAEAAVAAFARELLEARDVGVDDDLLALGADSLVMFRLVARINEALDAGLGLREAFAAPTVAGLAAAATRR